MSRLFVRLALLSFVVILSSPALWASAQESGTELGGVTVLAPDEDYAGLSRAEWDVQSWQSALSFSMDASPSFDATGDRCGFGQNGPMFFLPGNFTTEPGTMTCVVPAGMAIYVNIASTGCSTVEPPPFFGANEQELTECALGWNEIWSTLEASVNGEPLPDVESYLVTTPMYTISFPPGNFYEIDPIVGSSVSATYSFIIAPPEPGEYVIEVTGAMEGDAFVQTHTVIVTEPQVIMPEASPEAATPAS